MFIIGKNVKYFYFYYLAYFIIHHKKLIIIIIIKRFGFVFFCTLMVYIYYFKLTSKPFQKIRNKNNKSIYFNKNIFIYYFNFFYYFYILNDCQNNIKNSIDDSYYDNSD